MNQPDVVQDIGDHPDRAALWHDIPQAVETAPGSQDKLRWLSQMQDLVQTTLDIATALQARLHGVVLKESAASNILGDHDYAKVMRLQEQYTKVTRWLRCVELLCVLESLFALVSAASGSDKITADAAASTTDMVTADFTASRYNARPMCMGDNVGTVGFAHGGGGVPLEDTDLTLPGLMGMSRMVRNK